MPCLLQGNIPITLLSPSSHFPIALPAQMVTCKTNSAVTEVSFSKRANHTGHYTTFPY